jgi:ankyrin repeat protein
MNAALHGHLCTVIALLAVGASPNTEDSDGITALDLADNNCRTLIEAELLWIRTQ